MVRLPTDLAGLPDQIPIFPLDGVLLLPRGRLPLNIFEPRYLAMTEDALRSPDRLIGMVQPNPQQPAIPEGPAVFEVGCAGRIAQFLETDDGRYEIELVGVCRFRIHTELGLHRGYRRVGVEWREFVADLAPDAGMGLDRPRLVSVLRAYFDRQGLSANWDAIEQAPEERLVTSLAMICPFAASEKQALLEARTGPERAGVLTALLEMAVAEQKGKDIKLQ